MTGKTLLFVFGQLLAGIISLEAQYRYVTNNDSLTITGYTGPIGALTIPSRIDGLSVTSIGNGAFNETTITSVTIPETVTQIGMNAFKTCFFLTNAAIANSVSNIGLAAFEDCTALTSLRIGDGVTTIGLNAFAFCAKLPAVALPSGLTSMGANAFQSCTRLTNVVVPGNLTQLQKSSFQGCTSLASVTIGYGVLNIGSAVFSACSSLREVTIPGSVTNIGDHAFGGCTSLATAYFKGNAPSIDPSAFGGTSATIYYLPGTTGWDSTTAGIPVVVWRPNVLLGDSIFGIHTNGFGFSISWANGTRVVIEACTNLVNPIWVPVGTNELTSDSSIFIDSHWAEFSTRFYRLISP